MRLEQLVRPFIKWWWLILVTVLVASLTSYLGTRASRPTYISQTTLLVGQTLQSPNPSEYEFSTGQVLARNYADLARREPVLRAALDMLGLEWDWTALRDMVSSRARPGTAWVEIAVTDTDPQRAQILANEIANQLILQGPTGSNPANEAERQFTLSQMQQLQADIKKGQQEIRALDEEIVKAATTQQIQDARSQQAAIQTQLAVWQANYARLGAVLQQGALNSLRIVEPAVTPQPIMPRVSFNVAIAAAIGLALAVSAALVLEYLDDSIKTPDDVRRALNLASLGSIPRFKSGDYPAQLVMLTAPRSPAAEAFRALRARLQADDRARPLRMLLLTSSTPEEGKSLITANLAATLAQSGQRVILVDADLRRPTLHKIFELDNQVGLSTLLTNDRVNLDDALHTAPIENLDILTSGPPSEDSSNLIASRRMLELVKLLQQHAEIVIFDSPPVMAVSDATILAQHMDSTVLVIDSGKTRQAIAQRSQDALEAVQAHLTGVVLNRLAALDNSASFYYYANDGARHQQRTKPSTSKTGAALPGATKTTPILRPGPLPTALPPITPLERPDSPARRPLPELPRTMPLLESKPLPPLKLGTPPIVTPAVEQAVPKAISSSQEMSARAVRAPRTPASTVSRGRRELEGSKVSQILKQHGRSLALLGTGISVVLLVVLAMSSLGRQTWGGTGAPTRVIVAAQPTVNPIVSTRVPESTATVMAKDVNLTQRPTVDAPIRVAATETAIAGATATQLAINASAAQQAVGFLSCDTIDFEILESPVDVTSVSTGSANLELTWRVRNKARSPYCKWGQERQETKLLRAVEVGQVGASMPVTLKWIDNDEYTLSLKTTLGIGRYTLRWKLLLPSANSPSGPELRASAVVLTPTRTLVPSPIPTPTLVPTSTPCPEKVYACNCKQECSGRECTTVCDECVKLECK